MIYFILSLFINSAAAGNKCSSWREQGVEDARDRSVAGSAIGGVAGGAIGSLLGTAIATGVVAAGDSHPYYEDLDSIPDNYQECYIDGYRREFRRRKIGAAIAGGLPVSIIWLLAAL